MRQTREAQPRRAWQQRCGPAAGGLNGEFKVCHRTLTSWLFWRVKGGMPGRGGVRCPASGSSSKAWQLRRIAARLAPRQALALHWRQHSGSCSGTWTPAAAPGEAGAQKTCSPVPPPQSRMAQPACTSCLHGTYCAPRTAAACRHRSDAQPLQAQAASRATSYLKLMIRRRLNGNRGLLWAIYIVSA